eukprot:1378151-Rhodomonas_salina.1
MLLMRAEKVPHPPSARHRPFCGRQAGGPTPRVDPICGEGRVLELIGSCSWANPRVFEADVRPGAGQAESRIKAVENQLQVNSKRFAK